MPGRTAGIQNPPREAGPAAAPCRSPSCSPSHSRTAAAPELSRSGDVAGRLGGVNGPDCPELERLLARAAGRVRGRRAAVGALLGLGMSGVVACALELVRTAQASVGEPPFGHLFAFGAGAAVLAVGVAFAVSARWGRVDEEALARGLDRRLGLPDTAATVLALSRGTIASPLAPYVVESASGPLAAAIPRVDAAFVLDRPARAALRGLAASAIVTWLCAIALLVADLLHWFDFGFGLLGRHPDRDTGVAAQADPDVDRPVPAGKGGAPGGDAPRPSAPDERPPDPPNPDRESPAPPEDAHEPDVRAVVKPARESFRRDEPVLVVVSALPTREIAADRTLTMSLDVDGTDAPARQTLTLGPTAPLGAGEIVDLRRVPGLAGKLGAGEHRVTARLREADGTTYASAPATFRIEADGGPGGAKKPEPKPKPDAADPPPQPPPGSAPEPQTRGPGVPPPELPPRTFDPKIVVPLFRDGEEIAKRGPVVVLEPGGGRSPEDAPRQVPAESAIEDAARRAESQVDRGSVRPSDRDLVRRYFEGVRRLLR